VISYFFRTMAALAVMLFPSMATAQDFNTALEAARAGDFETARRLFEPLANQGDAASQVMLGSMHSQGLGVPKDETEAVRWFRLAAEQGSADGQVNLGNRYFNGAGVAQDYVEAAHWYEMAAMRGVSDAQDAAQSEAQFHLGYLYFEGMGVPQDYATAYMWSQIALINGTKRADKERDRAAAKLTLAQRTVAQNRAEACIASAYRDCGESTSFAQHAEYDAQRLRDILAISDMLEAFYDINSYYPRVHEPQLENVNIVISDYSPRALKSDESYKLLEAELQETLGKDAVLPKDPFDVGIAYQYATNGVFYYVSAFLHDEMSLTRAQGRHVHKIEVTNRPSLKTQSFKPDYLRHVIKYGPEDEVLQAAFFEAVSARDFDKAQELLNAGANPSPTCGFNSRCQLLATAARDGDLALIEFLVENGADIDGFNAYYDVALIYALESEQIEAAKLLVHLGANVNIPNAFGVSPFAGGSASGDLELVKLMIKNGGALNKNYFLNVSNAEAGERNFFPLEFAISSGNEEIIALLLEAGADPTLHTNSGDTIAAYGRASKNKAIRELF
jgi:hypothetical protein